MRTWIEDQWLKNATRTLDDGTTVNVPPTPAMKRSLNRCMDRPENADVPMEHRAFRYGIGARWLVYWSAPDGRHKKAFTERRAAEAFQAGLEDDIRSSRYINPKDRRRTFDQAAEQWKDRLAGTVKQSTQGRYLRELRVWVMPRWEDVPLDRITTNAIQHWVSQLTRGTAPRRASRCDNKPLAAKSIRSIVKIVMKAVLDQARDDHWIDHNPVDDVKLPRSTVATPRVYLTPGEIRMLANQALEPHATLILTLAYTGMRIGEALALRVGDLDPDRRRLNVTKTQSVDVRLHTIETLPKGNRTRTVPYPIGLEARLLALCEGRNQDAYLFRAPRGGYWQANNWRSRIWRPLLRDVGMDDIEGLSIHSLRHSYASIAIKNGCDVKTLQTILGHASATETLDTYADLWPDRLGEVADAMNMDLTGA